MHLLEDSIRHASDAECR